MKLLTIAVPCYNSQEYMHYCLQTLLAGGEEVEILIINDGSKDNTARIADQYAAAYPTIIRAIHQENKGHGSKKLGKKSMCSLRTSSMKKKARKRRKSCATLQRFLKTKCLLGMMRSRFVVENT